MARTRNIKPGFFLNDELAEIEPLGRLLFAGLWTIADREGRLEDRAKKIKAEILPYDDCDIDALLDKLHEHGFIQRYQVEGAKYIQICTFSKHQVPHIKEKASEIPPFRGGLGASEVKVQDKSCASTVQEQDKSCINPSLTLNPYTLTLNPSYSDSEESQSPPVSEAGGRENVPYQEIVEHYKRLCPSLPFPSKLSNERRTQIKARWCNDLHKNFDELDAFLKRTEASDFLTGRSGARAKPFGIDWIFKQQNFLKIQEGNYDNKSSPCQPVLSAEEKAERDRKRAEENARYEALERERVKREYGGGISESA